MRRGLLLLTGIALAFVLAWFAAGLVVRPADGDLGGPVLVTPARGTPSTTSPTSPPSTTTTAPPTTGTGANPVPPPTACPAGQTFDPDEDDPDDRCDD